LTQAVTTDSLLAIAAKMIEQGMATVRAEMAARLAQKDTEIATLRDTLTRLQDERGQLIERVRELSTPEPAEVEETADD
jgi:DNA anti-recombination protein RmuC